MTFVKALTGNYICNSTGKQHHFINTMDIMNINVTITFPNSQKQLNHMLCCKKKKQCSWIPFHDLSELAFDNKNHSRPTSNLKFVANNACDVGGPNC